MAENKIINKLRSFAKKCSIEEEQVNFEVQHRKEGELHRILDSVKPYYQEKIKSNGGYETFEVSLDEIKDFAKTFFEDMITDEQTRDYMLGVIDGTIENVELDFQLKEKKKGSSVDFDYSSHKTVVKVNVGEQLPDGRIKTDFNKIKQFIHEVSHSASQKFNVQHRIDCEKKHIPAEKSVDIGEIESHFIENLLGSYLLKKWGSKEAVLGLSEEQLGKSIVALKNERYTNLINHCETIINPKNNNKSGVDKNYEHRYVIGEVVSTLIGDEYLKDSQTVMNRFCSYLKQNAGFDVDEAIRDISGGKISSYPEAMDLFNEKHRESMKSRVENLEGTEKELEEFRAKTEQNQIQMQKGKKKGKETVANEKTY